MYCVKCGTKLEQGKCQSCGFVDELTKASGTSDVKEPNVKKQKVKRKLKWFQVVLIVLAAVVIIGAGGYFTFYFINDVKYNEALIYLEKDPDKAKRIFEGLGDYRESKEYLEESHTFIDYYDAVGEYEEQEYEKALEMFEELGRFEDSEEYAQLCQNNISYIEARGLFDSDDFEKAIGIFITLGDFRDSQNMASYCQTNIDYDNAQRVFAEEDYETALPLFEALAGFKDSADLAYKCRCMVKFDEALTTYFMARYDATLEMLKVLEDEISASEIDFSSILPTHKIRFVQGYCYYNLKLYFLAYDAFTKAGSYMDSSEMAASCIQPMPEEGELFRHEDYDKKKWRTKFIWNEETDYDAYIMIYDNGLLISTVFVERGDLLRVWYPYGTYDYEIYYGDKWFGEKEKFGSTACDKSITLTTSTTMSTKVYLGKE